MKKRVFAFVAKSGERVHISQERIAQIRVRDFLMRIFLDDGAHSLIVTFSDRDSAKIARMRIDAGESVSPIHCETADFVKI